MMIDGINQLPAQTYFYQKDIIGWEICRETLGKYGEIMGKYRPYAPCIEYLPAFTKNVHIEIWEISSNCNNNEYLLSTIVAIMDNTNGNNTIMEHYSYYPFIYLFTLMVLHGYRYVYPLVNVYITMERSTIFNGKTHDFNGHFQ